MSKSLTELAAEIVAAQASHTSMTPEEISDTLKAIHRTLSQVQASEGLEGDAVETEIPDDLAKLQANPKRSIKQNQVICLECGQEYKMLTKRHLSDHELTPREYRKKWGFSMRQALSSKKLSAARKKTAEEHGLADKLAEARKLRAAGKPAADKPAAAKKEKKSPQKPKKSAPAPKASEEIKEFKPKVIRRKKDDN